MGAPYEDGGAGRVFIYHGSKQGVKAHPAQVSSCTSGYLELFSCLSTYFTYFPVISPSLQILSGKGYNMKLFGYSLAGNMDLDGNSYPDVAVGSLSDTAVIFR